jgi:hypothetical protein
LLVEWTDDAHSQIEARLAARSDDGTKAVAVVVSIDLTTALMGQPAIWRCARTADGTGESCRELGGLSTHTDVTADLLNGAFTAYGPNSDQEALYQFLEGNV